MRRIKTWLVLCAILGLAFGAIGLSYFAKPSPLMRCATFLQEAESAHKNGYYAQVLKTVGTYLRDPYCQRLSDPRPLQLATTARLYVPELAGRERTLHLGLLQQLGAENWSAANRKSWAQALLATGKYHDLLALPLDTHANPDTMFLKLAAATAVGDQNQVQQLLTATNAANTPPLLSALLAFRAGVINDTRPSAYQQFWQAIDNGMALAPSTLAQLTNKLRSADAELMLRAALINRRFGLINQLAARIQPENLSARALHIFALAAWQTGETTAARYSIEHIRSGMVADPDTILMLCDPEKQVSAPAITCAELWQASDQAERIGAAYAALWTRVFHGLDQGAAAYAGILTALERIADYQRPNGPRYAIQARLYAQLGENELAVAMAAKAARLLQNYKISQARNTPLKIWQDKLKAGATISDQDVLDIKADSSADGIIWRLASAQNLADKQTDAAYGEAILLLREVLEILPDRSAARAITHLRLATHYAHFRDVAATGEALDQALSADAASIALIYPLIFGFYQDTGPPFVPRKTVDMWHKFAWREARRAGINQPQMLVVDRLTGLLMMAKTAQDAKLIQATCKQLTMYIGPINACNG